MSILTACQQTAQVPSTNQPVVTADVATADLQLTILPMASQVATDVGYPAPAVVIQPNQPYPNPVELIPTATIMVSVTQTGTSSSTTPEISSILPAAQTGNDPYPAPTSTTMATPNPSTSTTSDEIQNEAPILTPTANSLPFPLRTELVASDPSDFKLTSGSFQLVEFFAFWSPACKSMAPILYTLEDDYGGLIRFVYLDIDDPANSLYKNLLADRMPPLFFLLDENGNLLQTWQGYTPRENFEIVFRSLQP